MRYYLYTLDWREFNITLAETLKDVYASQSKLFYLLGAYFKKNDAEEALTYVKTYGYPKDRGEGLEEV